MSKLKVVYIASQYEEVLRKLSPQVLNLLGAIELSTTFEYKATLKKAIIEKYQ